MENMLSCWYILFNCGFLVSLTSHMASLAQAALLSWSGLVALSSEQLILPSSETK